MNLKKLYRLNINGKKIKNAILHYPDCARNCAQGNLNTKEILSQTSITNFTLLFNFNFLLHYIVSHPRRQ